MRKKVWRTAREQTLSMVKRLRSQSQEQPMRMSCSRIRAWYWSFQAQIRSTRPSRPTSCRVSPSSSFSRFSTTAWVAMPAWSVPGIHRVLSPCIRCQRMSTSCMELSMACPMCRAPVTLGSGIMMT